MLPFVGKLEMWQSGMAGTIPAVACFVLAGTLLFGAARFVLGSFAAGLCGCPFVRHESEQAISAGDSNVGAGLPGDGRGRRVFRASAATPWRRRCFRCGASMTRYEGWALIPVSRVVLLFTRGFRSAVIFGAIAAIPPLYWLATTGGITATRWNSTTDPTRHKMIYERAVRLICSVIRAITTGRKLFSITGRRRSPAPAPG